ncbi:MAG: fumarate reductase subunit C [Gammaproteobacteria bacterium]|nr:MAG: fumarate reductase subunit C [Gammaproteobacteria bacterium]
MTPLPTWQRGMRGWWRRDPAFRRYLLREATSVAIGAYALMLLAGLGCLVAGPAAWQRWEGLILSPVGLLLQAVVFAAAVIHAVSWFRLMPLTIPPLGRPGRRLADGAIHAGAWAASALCSLGLLGWLVYGA